MLVYGDGEEAGKQKLKGVLPKLHTGFPVTGSSSDWFHFRPTGVHLSLYASHSSQEFAYILLLYFRHTFTHTKPNKNKQNTQKHKLWGSCYLSGSQRKQGDAKIRRIYSSSHFFVLNFIAFLALFRLKVCGNPMWSKTVGVIFPTACLSLYHILIILAIFQTFPLTSYLLG